MVSVRQITGCFSILLQNSPASPGDAEIRRENRAKQQLFPFVQEELLSTNN